MASLAAWFLPFYANRLASVASLLGENDWQALAKQKQSDKLASVASLADRLALINA